MKKTLTRILSLLLVLIMLIGVLPMAFADDPVDGGGGNGTVGGEDFDDPTTDPVPPPADDDDDQPTLPAISVSVRAGSMELTLEDGVASTTLEAVLSATVPSGYTVTFEWEGTGVTGANGNAASFTAAAAGTYTVDVYATFTNTADPTDETTIKGSTSITVTGEPLEIESVTIKGDKKIELGGTAQLELEFKPEGYVPVELDWYSLDINVATVSDKGVVTGLKKGEATIMVIADGKRDTLDIEVVDAVTKVSVTESMILAVGESDRIEVSIEPEDAGSNAKITYTSVSSSIASVSSSGLVTAKSKGETLIKVSVKNVANFENEEFYVAVTVTDDDLTCDVKTVAASSTGKTVTLEPDYDGEASNVTFRYTKIDSRGTVSVSSDGVVTATGPAAIRVKVEALSGGEVVAECYTGASFYETNVVKVTMPENNTTLRFSANADIKESGNLFNKLIANYSRNDTDRVYVTNLDTVEGRLDGTAWFAGDRRTTVNGLYGLTFTVGTKGDAKFNYNIVMGAYEDLPLVKGTVEIDYDAKISGIRYSSDSKTAITFNEADFNAYWKASEAKGNLKYIKLNALPSSSTEGSLYTSKTSKTSTYAASTSHEYWYGSYTSSTTRKDLGALTFVPLAAKTTEYTVYIPFTAYGDNSGETVTLGGYVIIDMNEPTNDITARGTYFGAYFNLTQKITYADQIADAYEEATGEDLGYVVFKLPDAEQAHLYYDIPSNTSGNVLVAQGKRMPYNTKLYYNDFAAGTLDLKDTYLIPAAGFSGKITLKFEASDINGDNEWEGSITFNVTKKTKSAIFSDVSTTYSWAADSVDFLYYEGTAQGSNNKYNPASNITRGDFMLMLYRAFLEKDYGSYTVTANFPDVVKGTSSYSQETYQAVGVAKYLGIAQGTNNKFNPKASITREEAMALIQRTLNKTGRTLDYTTTVRASSFTDYSQISSWAKTSIDELVAHGVIVGNNNKVNPKSNITRAEMACILHRVITY